MQHLRLALASTILVALLAGCGATAAPASPAAPGADALITSGSMEFDTDSLVVPAGRSFTLRYVNRSPMPHNVAIYGDDSLAQEIMVGEVIGEGSVDYEVPALGAGEYFFRCDIHPEMAGTVLAR